MKLILLVALITGCTSSSHFQSNAGISSDGRYGLRYESQQRQYRAEDDGVDGSVQGNVGLQDQMKNSQVLQASPLQQSSGADAEQQPQQFARDVEQQKSQNDDEVVRDDGLQSSAQSPQSPLNRSPSLLPSSVPEVKVKQQIEDEVSKRKVSVQSVDSLVSSSVGIGGVGHQQIIAQSVPVVREQSLSSVHVIPQQRVQLVQQSLPFVSYSQSGYSSLIPQREVYLPSYSYVPNVQQPQQQVYQVQQVLPIQQNSGVEQVYQPYGREPSQVDEYVGGGVDVSQLPVQSPMNRSPSLLPSSVQDLRIRQQNDALAERDVIFPQVLTGQRRLTEPVEEVPKRKVSVQSVETLISSSAGIGGVSHQQVIPQSVQVIRDQSVPSVQVPQRVQVVQQQALPFVSYSQLGQQREIQVPSVVNVQNQQQLVNQVVREVKRQVQPIYQSLRSQPLPSSISGQRQYIQTLLQPSVHHLVLQPQSIQLSPLRQLFNPYQSQNVLQVRQWPEWGQQLQPLSGGSQLILQPLQYSGAHDHRSVSRLDGRGYESLSGYEMSAKPDDNLKLVVDQQSEPHPGLYGHQIGTKSVGSVNV